MKTFDFASEMAIDTHALDREWVEQPQKFLNVSSKLAEAKRSLALLKEQRDVIRAEVTKFIRSNPEKYGIEGRVTEGGIQATLDAHRKVKAINAEVIEAEYVYDIHFAAMRAFDQRKDALENLVRLMNLDYFSMPNAGKAHGGETLQKAREQSSAKAKQKMKESMRHG